MGAQETSELAPELTPDVLQTMSRVAVRVARRYARRVWRVDAKELEQVAWAALLSGWRGGSFDEACGDLGGWCWRIAAHAVSREVIVSGSPVSSSQNGSSARAKHAVGHTKVDVDEHPQVANKSPYVRTPLTPEARYIQAEIRAQVRGRIVEALGVDAARFLLAVCSREWTPEEIAEHSAQSVQSVYNARTSAVRKLKGDPELWRLWKEME